jgi:hypothetical protein
VEPFDERAASRVVVRIAALQVGGRTGHLVVRRCDGGARRLPAYHHERVVAAARSARRIRLQRQPHVDAGPGIAIAVIPMPSVRVNKAAVPNEHMPIHAALTRA